jgi:cell wall-associated NlpC family hydrolase
VSEQPIKVGQNIDVDTDLDTSDPTGVDGIDAPVLNDAVSLNPLTPQISLAPAATPAKTVATKTASGDASGQRGALLDYAKTALGVPYVWGGTNMKSGVDCSGFVQAVYRKFGVTLPRISFQQATAGKRISLKSLKPGDLVAWDNSSRNSGADHIAIYVGNGQVIAAPHTGTVVKIEPLFDTKQAWGVDMSKYLG